MQAYQDVLRVKEWRIMEIRKDRFYTKEHEWIKIEGDKGTMGITGYAADTLGDITFVEFLQAGAQVGQFARIGSIESVKAASDFYSPLSGSVAEVNTKAGESPEIINQSPYDEGWLVKIDIKDSEAEKGNLMAPEEYENYVKTL